MSKSDSTDDTNYFSSLKYGRDENTVQDTHVDLTDAYANYKQYVISFLHEPTGKTVYFKAFVTEYNESFNCTWQATNVYGRTDPIQNYSGTKRSITLAFDVPAASVGESYENLGRISKLVQMLYPTYSQNDIGAGKIIGSAPLVRVKMMNLITKEREEAQFVSGREKYETGRGILGPGSPSEIAFRDAYSNTNTKNPAELFRNYKTAPNPKNGVLAAISSVTYRSDLQKIQFFEKAPNTILPQSITVNISFDVIHEETLGWDASSKESLAESFPHKAVLSTGNDLKTINDDQSPADINARIAQERDNQAIEDQRRATKNKFMEKIGRRALTKGGQAVGNLPRAYTSALANAVGGKRDD